MPLAGSSDIRLTLEVQIQCSPFESDWNVILAGNLVLTNGSSSVHQFTIAISKTNGALSVTPSAIGNAEMNGARAYVNGLHVY